jgi:ABC-type sugar transport system substrate-binding protein
VFIVSTAIAHAEGPYRTDITQNNVGVDSYQTAYERAFVEAADANENVDIVFIGATNIDVGYDAIACGEYYGSIYQSPVDDAHAALQTALEVLAGEKVPKLNFFETPKITADNLEEFDRPVF